VKGNDWLKIPITSKNPKNIKKSNKIKSLQTNFNKSQEDKKSNKNKSLQIKSNQSEGK
jgi:hypothetical protein